MGTFAPERGTAMKEVLVGRSFGGEAGDA